MEFGRSVSDSANSHSVSFDQLMPVFLSTPVSHAPPTLPFKFTGGFSLSTKTIGFMLAVQGVYSMIAQLLLFPYLVRRFGTLNVFRTVLFLWPLLDFAVPYLVLLPQKMQVCGIYVCLITKITLHVLAFPSIAIIITNSAPSMLVLGTINGAAASTASLCRAFGPTITGVVHAAGLRTGYSGLAWWASGFICLLGAIESLWMTESKGRLDAPDNDEEIAMAEPFLASSSTTEAESTALDAADNDYDDDDLTLPYAALDLPAPTPNKESLVEI